MKYQKKMSALLVALFTSLLSWLPLSQARITLQPMEAYTSKRQQVYDTVMNDLRNHRYANYHEMIDQLTKMGYHIEADFEHPITHPGQDSNTSDPYHNGFRLRHTLILQTEMIKYGALLCPKELTNAELSKKVPGNWQEAYPETNNTGDLKKYAKKNLDTLRPSLENTDEIFIAQKVACIEVVAVEVRARTEQQQIVLIGDYMIHTYDENHSIKPAMMLNLSWAMSGALNTEPLSDKGVEQVNIDTDTFNTK